MKKEQTIPARFALIAEDVHKALCEAWEQPYASMWWVGGEPMYDALYIDQEGALTMAEAVYCLKTGVTYEEYCDCTEYNVRLYFIKERHPEADVHSVSLRAWHEGAPRMSEEELKTLEQ